MTKNQWPCRPISTLNVDNHRVWPGLDRAKAVCNENMNSILTRATSPPSRNVLLFLCFSDSQGDNSCIEMTQSSKNANLSRVLGFLQEVNIHAMSPQTA